MDRIDDLIRYVSLSGSIGRTVNEVREHMGGVSDAAYRALFAYHMLTESEDRVLASEEFQDIHLLDNRPLDMTATSRRALAHIAAAGHAGILQSDLSAALKMDNKSLFHHLKSLIHFELVTRLPVASNKTFTYLCILSKLFIDDPTDGAASIAGTALRPSSVVTKDAIMAVLLEAPHRTFTTKELFELCCPEGTTVKYFRRGLLSLVHDGRIDILSTRELGGSARLVGLKRGGGDRTPAEEPAVGDAPDQPPVSFAPLLVDFVPIERQVRDFVCSCGPTGTTMNEIISNFGLGRKFAFRLMERLTDSKSVVNTDVSKQAEFVGRERRYRFRVSAEDAFLPLSDVARDSITRLRRQEVLLALLRERKILEIGRPLANEIAKALSESSHMLDTKTLRRTVNYLKGAGQLTVHELSTVHMDDRTSSRTLITLPQVALGSADFARLLQATEADKSDAVTCDDAVEVNKYDLGWRYGFMCRLRLAHRVLAEQFMSSGADKPICILDVFFKDLSLSKYNQLVGPGVRVSRTYHDYSVDPERSSLALKTLPFQSELNARLRVHRKIVGKLVSVLRSLGLLVERSEVGAALAWRIPYKVDFQVSASLRVSATEEVDFTFKQLSDVDALWDRMLALAKVPEEVEDAGPHSFLLDIRNWADRPIRATTLKAIEGAAERVCNEELSQTLAVQELSEKYGIQRDTIAVYFDYYLRLMERDDDDEEGGGEGEEEGDGGGEEEDSTSPPDGRHEPVRRRRRLDNLMTKEESDRLKLLLVLIDTNKVELEGSLGSVAAGLFPGKTAEDLRKKQCNMGKSAGEQGAIKRLEERVLRIDQLERLGRIAPRPSIPAQSTADRLAALCSWYSECLAVLSDVENEIMLGNPRSLAEALNSFSFVPLPGKPDAGRWLSDCLDASVLAARKKAILDYLEAGELGDNVVAVESLIEYGLVHRQQDRIALSDRVKRWLESRHDFGPDVPERLLDRQPLTWPAMDAPVVEVFRLSAMNCLTLSSDSLSIREPIHYSLTVTKPSCEDGSDAKRGDPLWIDLKGELNRPLLYKSLGAVHELVSLNPGIPRQQLRSSLLSRAELDYSVDCLQCNGYIASIDNDHLFPV